MSPSIRSLPPLAWGLALAVLLLVAAVLLPDHDPRHGRPQPVADRTAPLTMLRAWDRERAATWRQGDVRALRRLYVAGSRAGRADRAMLRAYVARGLRVTGMRMQVASVEVVRADDARLVLRVTDRLVGADVRGAADALPVDRWSRRRVVLELHGERWLVSRVTPQDSAEAITAEASGSSNR